MIGHSLVALFLSLLFVAVAQAQSLKIADRKSSKMFSAAELLASPLARDITIARDPAYGRAMTYRAIPVTELLKGLEVRPQDYVDFVATDRFSIGIPARLLLRPGNPSPQAYLAIENPATPWPAMPDKGKDGGAGKKYSLSAVAKGNFDAGLRALGAQLRTLKKSPIVRPMPEPNTPWYAWSGGAA